MKQVKKGFSVKQQYKRGKRLVGMTTTIAGGFRAMHRIGAFKNPPPPREKLPPYVQRFCRKMSASFDIDVVEIEPVPKTHGLWASNHVSWMDIPLVGSVSPGFFLSKAEVGEWAVIGPLLKASGHLLIKRGSGDAGAVTKQISTFLSNGHSIIFFPEGTTTDGKGIKKLHGKLLKSAIDANVPVQPIVICYANKDGSLSDALPYYGKLTMKDSIKKVLDSKDVTAYVLPLEAIDTTNGDIEKLTEVLQKRMEDGLAELHERVAKKQTTPMRKQQSNAPVRQVA